MRGARTRDLSEIYLDFDFCSKCSFYSILQYCTKWKTCKNDKILFLWCNAAAFPFWIPIKFLLTHVMSSNRSMFVLYFCTADYNYDDWTTSNVCLVWWCKIKNINKRKTNHDNFVLFSLWYSCTLVHTMQNACTTNTPVV